MEKFKERPMATTLLEEILMEIILNDEYSSLITENEEDEEDTDLPLENPHPKIQDIPQGLRKYVLQIKAALIVMDNWYRNNNYFDCFIEIMENKIGIWACFPNSQEFLVKCFIRKLGERWNLLNFILTICNRSYKKDIYYFIANSNEKSIQKVITAMPFNNWNINYIIELINDIIETNKDIMINGINIITYMCKINCNDIVVELIKKRHKAQDIALVYVCKNENIALARLLLENGISCDIIDPEEIMSAIDWAISKKNMEILQLIIANGGQLKDNNLLAASRNNNVEVVKMLIEQKVNINVLNNYNVSALILACDKSNEEIVKLLLDANADINHIDNDNENALIVACRYDNVEIVKMLLERNKSINENVNEMINKQNKFDFTALISACKKNNTEIIKLLIENNADIHIQNNNKDTALIWTCSKNNVEICKILIDKGVNVNTQNLYNTTALHCACENNNIEMVKMLLEKDIDVNTQGNESGNTPLIIACKKNNIEMAQMILNKALSQNVIDNVINVINQSNETPLSLADKHNNMELICLISSLIN
jgi:ankyrin repeat protein